MTVPDSIAEFAKTIKPMPAADDLKVIGSIYGPSGVGKTHLATTWTGPGKVLFGNIEDGYISLAGTGMAKTDLRTHNDLLNFYHYLKSGQHDYGLAFIDTFTEAKKFMSAQIAGEKAAGRASKNPYELSMDDYKQANEMLRQWLWKMRWLPMHVFYICLPTTSRRKSDVVTKQTLDLGEALAGSLLAYSSVVGYMTIDTVEKPDGTTARARVLHLQPTDDYDAKLRLPKGFKAVDQIISPTLDKIIGLYKKPAQEG